MGDRRIGFLYIGLAVLFFSTSSILVRWAAPIHPITITAVRMLVGSLTVIATSLATRKHWHLPPAGDLKRYLLFGLIAAAHFGFYIAAVSLTTIAHALSITHTAPIWVTFFAWLFLDEPFPRQKLPGVALTVIGVAVLTGFEPQFSGRMLLGDLLALGSAVCFGFYSIAGRSQRERVPLFSYTATMYGVAAIWLALPGLLLCEPAALNWGNVAAIVAAGIIPLGVGHTLYNAALRHLHPTLVNVVATQEVTGGVLLGVILLGEVPALTTALGAGLSLVGVIWALI